MPEFTNPRAIARLRAQVAAVEALCDSAEADATRWENPLPLPWWTERIRAAIAEAGGAS